MEKFAEAGLTKNQKHNQGTVAGVYKHNLQINFAICKNLYIFTSYSGRYT